jgi:hypothetical protein
VARYGKMKAKEYFESISTDDANDFVVKLKQINLFKTYCNIAEAYYKAKVEAISDELQSKHDSFIGNQKDKITSAEASGFRQGLRWAISSLNNNY